MSKTSTEVIDAALRRIQVLGVGESASSEDHALSYSILQALFSELTAVEGAVIGWTIETVPDEVYLALAWYLAAMSAPDFGRPPIENPSSAWLRLRRRILIDDRVEGFDIDNDGVLSDDEQDAKNRAMYY